jgi:hypothetical protein
VLQEHLEQVVEQAVPTQRPGRVGGKLEAGADLGELLGPLRHAYPQPGAAQQQRGGEATDATPDDDRLVPVHDRCAP